MKSEVMTPQAAPGRGYMPQAKTTAWQTPPALFDALAAEFGPFDLDPCGDPSAYATQHCASFFTAPYGLTADWRGRVFVNPPYGRGLDLWVDACRYQVGCGNAELVVALLPARTDVRWWHTWVGDHCQYPSEVRFLKGRLRFVGAPASAPFPSVIVVWRRAP